MKISEARNRANKKWEKENYAQINLKFDKNKKQEIKASADAAGQSINRFIMQSIDERIKRDKSGNPAGSGN